MFSFLLLHINLDDLYHQVYLLMMLDVVNDAVPIPKRSSFAINVDAPEVFIDKNSGISIQQQYVVEQKSVLEEDLSLFDLVKLDERITVDLALRCG